MFGQLFQIGSLKAKFWKSARFGRMSPVDVGKHILRRLSRHKLKWLIKLLRVVKLITEIINNIHSLLSFKQPWILLGNWDNNKSYADS